MNDTIDTLKIKVEGNSESAVTQLDKVIATLERIKGSTSGRSLSALNNHLSKLSDTINSFQSKKLSRLTSLLSTLSNINRVNIPPRIADRIRDIGDSVRSLDGVDFSQLNRMADGLRAVSEVSNVRVPRIQVDNPARAIDRGAGTLSGTVDLESRKVSGTVEKLNKETKSFSDRVSGLTGRFRKARHSVKDFGTEVKSAFSDTIVGRFLNKVTETIRALGRIALYRVMRTAIKQVTAAFKTGIDNMYQYSKTFNGSYAQSMDRLASANLTFKNSIGAIMAPLIELVTPWLDSFLTKLVEINNTIAMVLAALAGKSTYSKAVRVTTEYAEAADKASDNTEKVKEKVEELKRSLAGLDEITIIGNQNLSPLTTSNVNTPVTNTPDYGSMFEETPIDMARVNEIKKRFEEILQYAKWIGIAIAAWELLKFITSIGEVLTGLGKINKTLLGLSMMIVGFGLEFSGAFHIGYGDAQLWDYIKTALGATLGIGGSLLVFGTGPLGWTIGIVAAVSIAIAGITVGMNQRLADVVEEAFYNAGGTITISDLADQFERYMRAIQSSHQPTINLGNDIQDTIDNHIVPLISEIKGIATAIKYDARVADEKCKEIKAKFDELYTNSKGVLKDTHDLIIQSIAGGFGDTLTALGIDIPEVMALINGTTTDIEEKMDEWYAKFEKLDEQREAGKISFDKYNTGLGELLTEFATINGVIDPVTESFNGVKESLEGIDWENKTQKDNAFNKIKESASNAKTAVEESYESLKKSLEYYARNAETEEARIKYQELISGSKAYRDQEMEKIHSATQELFEYCQNDMILKMQDVGNNLEEEYRNKHGYFFRLFNSEAGYINKGLIEYQRNVIEPIEKEMKGLYEDLGIEGNTYASDAAYNIIEGLWNSSVAVSGDRGTINTKSVLEAITDYYRDVGESMPKSLAKGIESRQKESDKASADIAEGIIAAFKFKEHDKIMSRIGHSWMENLFTSLTDTAEVHSPSKRSERLVQNILTGMIPKSNDKNNVLRSFEDLLNSLFDRLEVFTNRWRGAINTMFDDMAYGWKNADFRSDGSYSYSYLQMKNIQRFAQGGFPEDGLFYANHNELVGQFNNGKTAVANNEQIIEGIAGGVASANEEQNTLLREGVRLLRRLLEKDSTIDVSTIATAFSRKNQRDGKVTVPVSI